MPDEHHPDLLAFGQHLERLRSARGLTQEQVAEHSGLALDTIALLERGSFSPPLRTVRKLAAALDMRVSELFDGLEVITLARPTDASGQQVP